MKKYIVSYESPSAEDYIKLRVKVGWQKAELDIVKNALRCSLFHVVIYAQSQLVAMGRVIGDGAIFFYIQDVVVAPSHQGQGLGKLLMENIENFLSKNVTKGAAIGLLAAQGKEGFYKTWGYMDRTGAPFGRGMCKFI